MDHYILDNGDPVVQVAADDTGKITKVSKVGDSDWQYDYINEAQGKIPDLTLSQAVRLMGREAGHMTVDDYAKRRRVAKRVEEETIEVEKDMRVPGEIVKTDPAKQHVFGWAYVMQDKDGVEVVDKSGDFVDDISEIEDSAYDYVIKSRAGDADHTNVKGAEMIESIVFTPEKIEKMGLPAGSVPLGWWIGFHVEDEATWARVEKGELTSFSVHGSGVRTKVAPD